MKTHLFIRTDSTARMGTGHIMRCLALAMAWHDLGAQVTFLSYCESEMIRNRVKDEGFGFIPLPESCANGAECEKVLKLISNTIRTDTFDSLWFALDGYHFDETYQKVVKKHGCNLLALDDMARLPYYHADIVLNQNLHAEHLTYNCNPETILLLGPKHCLLRREFIRNRPETRNFSERAKSVLITLGGSDPDNVTLKVLAALKRMCDVDLHVKIVVGSINPNIDLIRKELSRLSFHSELLTNVNNMSDLMNWADLAICNGGTTVWELAYLGVPCIVGAIAPIEEYLLLGLEQKGLFKTIGWYSNISFERLADEIEKIIRDSTARQNMSRLGQTVIDGKGPERTCSAMMNLQ